MANNNHSYLFLVLIIHCYNVIIYIYQDYISNLKLFQQFKNYLKYNVLLQQNHRPNHNY